MRIPQKLLVGTVDPYALIVVEGFAAQTHMVRNSRNPRWGADVARAFRFPITCSYSSINVTINDKLADPVNPDNCLGRLRIDLGSVLSRTIYDCWYELLAPSADYNGKTSIGSVRLRYSVTWKGGKISIDALLPTAANLFCCSSLFATCIELGFTLTPRKPPH